VQKLTRGVPSSAPPAVVHVSATAFLVILVVVGVRGGGSEGGAAAGERLAEWSVSASATPTGSPADEEPRKGEGSDGRGIDESDKSCEGRLQERMLGAA